MRDSRCARTTRRLAIKLALCATSFVAITAAPQATAQRGAKKARPDSAPVVDSATRNMRMSVRPDTVTVGDPFVFTVAVLVATNAQIEWPSITDSAAMVAMREPVHVESAPSAGGRIETATYGLAAWDVGRLSLGLTDIIIRGDGAVRRVPLAAARVVVRSVLPGDTTMRVPKPAKALFPRDVPWWERWWLAAAIVAALLLLWWLWGRRRLRVAPSRGGALDPYASAQGDFAQLERLGLVDVGEGGRHVALAVEILRAYLHERVPRAALSRSSTELLTSIGDDPRVPLSMLRTLLDECDAIKFARQEVSPVQARSLASDARAILDQCERAEQAQRAADADRLRAESVADRAAAQAEEDDARRRSRRAKSGAR